MTAPAAAAPSPPPTDEVVGEDVTTAAIKEMYLVELNNMHLNLLTP